MNEHLFIQSINTKAENVGINPLLLLSGVEGLYTFKDVEISTLNYGLLDSLILTIFALRIGDKFHALAEENLGSQQQEVREAAELELLVLSPQQIEASSNQYLQSFAGLVNGKADIRTYHLKALEVAALEIKKAQVLFNNVSIGAIVFQICQSDVGGSLNLAAVFGS